MCLFRSNIVFPGVQGEDPYMDVTSVWRRKCEECQAGPQIVDINVQAFDRHVKHRESGA